MILLGRQRRRPEMSIVYPGQHNILPITLYYQEVLCPSAMFGEIREDEMQTSPPDGPCSNELTSYKSPQPGLGIKNNLVGLVLNCGHAAATIMDKLSITQPASWHQKMNNRIQKPSPEPHEDPTPLDSEAHEYSVPSA